MKDYTKPQLEAMRRHKGAQESLKFSLGRIYADKAHKITDEVVSGLSFEELLDALLCAQDELAFFWEGE